MRDKKTRLLLIQKGTVSVCRFIQIVESLLYKRKKLRNTIILLVVVSSLSSAQSKKAEKTESKGEYGHSPVDLLVSSVKEAAEKKSLEKYLKCTCWEKLPDKLKERFKKTTPVFMKHKLLEVKVEPSEEDPFGDNKDFKYNIQYLGNLVLKYEGYDGEIRTPYGRHNNRYYLATLVKRN